MREERLQLSILNLDIFDLLVRAMVLVTAMPIHECAHGYVADKLGDSTARRQGRLTLNPFAHLDLMGSIMIMVAGFGWAKPVPVNPYNFKINSRAGMAITAAAGPLSNILMAAITLLLAKIVLMTPLPSLLASIFLVMCQINLSLAVFNLLPVVPLDGSRILAYFLPGKIVDWMEEKEHLIYMVFLALVLFTNILSGPISFIGGWIFRGLNAITSLFGLLPML